MKIHFIPAVLSSVLLLTGVLRLAAQSVRPGEQDRARIEDTISRREIGQRQWFLDHAATIYRGDVERKQALLTSIKASTYDLNHDGKLDATERAAWEKRLRIVLSRTPEWMKRYDLNHDNILSDAEWDAAYLAIFESPAPMPAPASPGSAD